MWASAEGHIDVVDMLLKAAQIRISKRTYVDHRPEECRSSDRWFHSLDVGRTQRI
jgi:hypothetical protein